MTAILLLAVTKVMFFFDTEDFTCDESSDAIRETANILTAEGVRWTSRAGGASTRRT